MLRNCHHPSFKNSVILQRQMGVISHGKHACYSSPSSFGHPSELAFFLFILLQLIFSRLAFSRAITLLDCSCERAFHPVCGTDQQTYDSRCFLDCARRYDQELMLAYEGVCCPKAELCADYLDPVCDQMGNFYENDCIFDFHKCIQRRTGGGLPLLRVVGRGKMCTRRPPAVAAAGTRLGGGGQRPNHHHQQPQQQNATGQRLCDFFCDEVVTPVCDSQGRTHKNRCKFDLASCRLRSRGIVSALHILREGPCHKEDNNFGQFPDGSSIRRMSLANMMEGIRRERARKRLNLPSKTRAQETAESSETGRRQSAEPATQEPNNQSGNGKAPSVGDWSGEREREEDKEEEAADTGNQQSGEQIPEIPASRFFRDQQQQQTMTMARVNSSSLPERRWQLSQAQNQQIFSEQSTTAFSPTSARPWSREEMTFTNKNCPPASECPQLWDPLCDSHNRTHANECHFAIARCQFARIASRSEQPPKMAHRGKCSMIPTSSQQPMASKCDFCREENSLDQIVPVCDNTNLTHQSVCLFAQWNCAKRLRRAEEHVLGHVGECSLISPIFELKDEVCPAKCSRHFKPVCDSDGLTHPNLCAYQMFSCHQRKEGQPFGWLISLRECNQTDNNKSGAEVVDRGPAAARRAAAIECPEEPNCEGQPLADGDGPICDSEGRIHKNSCWFAHAHCTAAKLGKALRIVEDQNCPQLAAEERPTAPADDGQRQVAANCEQRWPNCAGTAVDPYCGSDFISYRNLCAIQKAHCMDGRVEILFKGECEKCLAEPCTPPNPADDLQFVCDQSGETKSVCEFQMLRCIYEAKFGYNITAAYQGKCCPGADACSMAAENSSEVDPVCDSQGRRHANHCLFKVAKCRAQKIAGQQLQERQCSDTENAKERQPSIGSGSTQRPSTAGPEFPAMPNEAAEVLAPEAMEAYGGVAEHQLQNTASPKPAEPTNPPKSNGSAELASSPGQQHSCSNRYEPMCGSDRRTYRNGCLLLERRNASSNARVSPPVRLLYPGECCPAPETCGPDHSPVCDNQGNTHLNLCEFGRQRCLAERIWAQNLTIVAYTMCPSLRCPRDKCPSRYEPVCATSGRTYANLCELDKSVCVLRSGLQGHFAAHPDNGTNEAERSSLALDYIGECCETAIECGEIVDPENGGPTAVCDNLGRSHRSECAFRRAACLARKREGQTLRPVQCPPSQSRNSQRQNQS